MGTGYLGATAGVGICTAIGIVGVGGVVCATVGATLGGSLGSAASDSFIELITQDDKGVPRG